MSGDQTRIILKDLKKPISGRNYGARTVFDVMPHDMCLRPEEFIFDQFANTTTVATISSYDMDINGDTAGGLNFFWENQTTTMCHITRVHFHILDGSIDPNDFGGINNGITNGLAIDALDTNGSSLISLTDGIPIRKNGEFGLLAGTDINIHVGTGDDAMNVRWTLEKAGAKMSFLKGQRLNINISDNLTAITNFNVNIQGHYLPGWV